MSKKDPRIDAYIREAAPFAKSILNHLRKIIHKNCPQIEESLKWGCPHFMYGGKILCGTAGFKAHCALHFRRGDQFIKKRKEADAAMGQFGRITTLKDLPSDKVLASYIKKAMRLNEDAALKTARTRKAR